MLEIKTIIEKNAEIFDLGVNDALAEGWELVRRDCFPGHYFYAELEREAEVEEEEPEEPDDAFTSWRLTRDPVQPYRCEKCGFKDIVPRSDGCPNCGRYIRRTE